MKFYRCRRCRYRFRAVQTVLPANRKLDTQTNYCNPLIPRSERLGLKIKQVNKSILENNEVSGYIQSNTNNANKIVGWQFQHHCIIA